MTEKLRKQILAFVPHDELETEYKKSFLQFIDAFGDDIWKRENLVGHVTSSGWIINQDKTKVLMIYHNLYDSWAWLGGHNDNDRDTLGVCKKEIGEECGVKEIKVLHNDILGIDVAWVNSHIKKGKMVPAHLHFNVTYLIEIDEDKELLIKPDENSGVKWIAKECVLDEVSEEHMKATYRRLMEKVEKLYCC